MRVLVVHSGLQHAHQLAWALYEAGDLAALWSGLPVAGPTARRLDWSRLSGNLHATPIPSALRRHFPWFPATRRLLTRTLPTAMANSAQHRLDYAFDRLIAGSIGRLRPDMVVAYENGALRSFEAARRIGAICVLDAASVDYRVAARLIGAGRDAAWIEGRKQQELDAADAIVTCSAFAAQSYRDNGVPAEKLFPCPLGTDLPAIERQAASGRCNRFVFVGSLIRRKGVDVLLDVFEALGREGTGASLTFITGGGEADLRARAATLPSVTMRPFLPQRDLFREMAQYDCLILPSRFDSFGMVVPEAMSVGVPAIVSDRVGAKSIIEQHPDAGWVVPFDAAAIRAQIMALVADHGRLDRASASAALAARDFSWEAYRRRIVAILRDIAGRRRGLEAAPAAPRGALAAPRGA